MKRAPAFQFYADDFVSGTQILTTEEVGAYILLLCHQWSTGGVPNDDNLIRRIAKITQAFPLGLVKSKFELVDGVLKNRRLETERSKQAEYRQKQAENGAKGGRPKTQAFPKPNPTPNPNITSPSPSPSPSPIPKKTLVASLPNDADFIKSLKANESYRGIDIDRELGRMTAWCQANRRQASRRRFVNWLNRVDRPITAKASEGPVGGRF